MHVLFEEKLVFEYSHSEISDWRAAMQGAVPSTIEEVEKVLRKVDGMIKRKELGEALGVLGPLYLSPSVRGRKRSLVQLSLARIALEKGQFRDAVRHASDAKKHLTSSERAEAEALMKKAQKKFQVQAA